MAKKQEEQENNEIVKISKSKYDLIKKILNNVNENLNSLIDVLDQEKQEVSGELAAGIGMVDETMKGLSKELDEASGQRVIEGVFDGMKMIAEDGQTFVVPPNYASKSKLIEGDMLKLTIKSNGDFLYKQIGPVERKRLVGEIIKESDDEFYAKVKTRRWKLLPASVSFFKGDAGDEVVILVPKEIDSKWAAVENVIKK